MTHLVSAAKAYLAAKMAKPGYKGLTFEEFQQMVRLVRVAPPPAARPDGYSDSAWV
jgi:hypothetical protein